MTLQDAKKEDVSAKVAKVDGLLGGSFAATKADVHEQVTKKQMCVPVPVFVSVPVPEPLPPPPPLPPPLPLSLPVCARVAPRRSTCGGVFTFIWCCLSGQGGVHQLQNEQSEGRRRCRW